MNPTQLSKWWIFLVTTSGTSLVFLDTTVIPVALPSIQKELLFDPIGLVWIVNAYLLSLTALLLVGGRLCDLFGKRSLFIWGLSIFGVGSLLGALSHTQWLLLTARIVQGAGGALTIPTTSALLISTFPVGERARAIGINTGISGIFLVLGPALGGFLTEYISWRSIFLMNIPLVIFGIVMASVILKPGERKKESFHFAGTLTMFAAIVSLVIGLMQANSWGWSSPWIVALLVASPLLFALFVMMSLRAEHPIIDFRFFRNRLFTVANISIFITSSIIMVTVLWAIYFQEQLGYSPSETGLLIFVAAFPVFLMAPLGGYFADRCGPRLPLLLGFAILIFALFWLLFTAHSKQILVLLPGLLGFGCSLPMIMSPTVALALSQVDPAKLGAASGITTATRQIASTTGIALMTAVYLGTVKASGSHAEAFSAISMLAGILAFIGFWVIFCIIRRTNHA
ncbi:MFS transporter [Chlamydiota bacterium]